MSVFALNVYSQAECHAFLMVSQFVAYLGGKESV